MNYDILVYDMEVYMYDWFFTAKSLNTGEYFQIHNDLNKLQQLYDVNKNGIWSGHNILRYDNIIFKCLLKGIEGPQLKEISNKIINDENMRGLINDLKLNSITMYSLDIMQDAIRYSLKEIEGYFGMSIEETEIPFDLQRPLTEDEIKLVFKYNKHDVDATIEEISLRYDRLVNKLVLLEEYNLPLTMLEYTNQQLCAEILQANYTTFKDGLKPYDLSIAPIEIHKYTDAISLFTDCKELDYNKKLEMNIANVPHIVSNGGIHGAIENFMYKGDIWLVDVGSYYPNMMINFNLCSRAMSHPENFKNLVAKRMNAKENKKLYTQKAENETDETKKNEYLNLKNIFDKKSNALKLPINTTSGAMKAKFSKLFDERNNNWMCITGQLLLIDLIESMEDCMKLIQSNTDGIIIIPLNKELCDEKIKYWENKTGLILEKTIAKLIYQKDVNNYILQSDNGKIKTKGAFVSQYHNDEFRFADIMRSNLEIIDDAVVDFLVYNIPLETTIRDKSKKLRQYQIIKKLGGMYDDIILYRYDKIGNKYVDNSVNRINRIFATTDKSYGKLMKKHNKKITYDTVEGCPDRCLVYNKDIRNLTANDLDLDFDWYINEAKNRIIKFILPDNLERQYTKLFKLSKYSDEFITEYLWNITINRLHNLL